MASGGWTKLLWKKETRPLKLPWNRERERERGRGRGRERERERDASTNGSPKEITPRVAQLPLQVAGSCARGPKLKLGARTDATAQRTSHGHGSKPKYPQKASQSPLKWTKMGGAHRHTGLRQEV